MKRHLSYSLLALIAGFIEIHGAGNTEALIISAEVAQRNGQFIAQTADERAITSIKRQQLNTSPQTALPSTVCQLDNSNFQLNTSHTGEKSSSSASTRANNSPKISNKDIVVYSVKFNDIALYIAHILATSAKDRLRQTHEDLNLRLRTLGNDQLQIDSDNIVQKLRILIATLEGDIALYEATRVQELVKYTKTENIVIA